MKTASKGLHADISKGESEQFNSQIIEYQDYGEMLVMRTFVKDPSVPL